MKRYSLAINIILLTFCNSMAQKPDILFFISDDLGYYDISTFAKTQVRTPNITKFAKEGLSFKNAFVVSPSCAPSRAAMLTGQMPARNGAEANHTFPRPDIPYLFKKFQENGYEVIAFGKIGHAKSNVQLGFDYYEEANEDIAEKVASYFANKKKSKPILLLIGDHRPHAPWTKNLTYKPEEITLNQNLIDTKETRLSRAMYYTEVGNLDTDFGKVLDIANKYLSPDRISLFSSDHGSQWPLGKWNLYDSGIRCPLIINQKGIITANKSTDAMVSWIDIFPTLFDMVGIALPPKIDGKSFIHLLKNQKLNHRSEIFTTHSGDGKMNVYPIRSIRTQKYKYILNLYPENFHTTHADMVRHEGSGFYWNSWDSVATNNDAAKKLINRILIRPAEELYDLETDPFEQNNLANISKYTIIVSELKSKLTRWMDQQGDSKKLFNPPYPISGGYPKQ